MNMMPFLPRLGFGSLIPKANRDRDPEDLLGRSIKKKSRLFRRRDTAKLPRTGSRRPLDVLAALPQEILLCICDFLPPVEICCLAYASPSLRHQLRDHPAIWQVRRGFNQKEAVLRRLRGFELPFCNACRKRHDVDASRYPARRLRDVPACIKSDKGLALTPYNADDRFKLGFHHIHLIMQDYRHPGRGVTLNSLNFSQYSRTTRHANNWSVQKGILTSVDARIITDNLYLRIQNWHIFRSLYSLHHGWALLVSAKLCIHQGDILGIEFKQMVTRVIASQECLPRQQMEPLSIIGKTITMECDTCCGVYEMSARALDDRRVAFVVTKWLDLGDCLDADDRDWQRHIKRDRQLGRTSSKETKSARFLYEMEGSDFDVEELTKRNEADLLGKKYRSWKRVSNVTRTTRL